MLGLSRAAARQCEQWVTGQHHFGTVLAVRVVVAVGQIVSTTPIQRIHEERDLPRALVPVRVTVRVGVP
jgi:hypothetical protein